MPVRVLVRVEYLVDLEADPEGVTGDEDEHHRDQDGRGLLSPLLEHGTLPVGLGVCCCWSDGHDAAAIVPPITGRLFQ